MKLYKISLVRHYIRLTADVPRARNGLQGLIFERISGMSVDRCRGRPVKQNCMKCRYYPRREKSKRKKRQGLFFKGLVSAVVLHGMICVSMSYALAWMEHTQVVEIVSSTIITEIVAPVIIYGFTKTVENIFQKNELTFSTPVHTQKKEAVSDSEAAG